jgi:hypothetical protein
MRFERNFYLGSPELCYLLLYTKPKPLLLMLDSSGQATRATSRGGERRSPKGRTLFGPTTGRLPFGPTLRCPVTPTMTARMLLVATQPPRDILPHIAYRQFPLR